MRAVRVVLPIMFFVPMALALGQQSGSDSGASANQVPLSGRGSSTGSVAVQQSPIAGTTQSVNTINSSLSIQGPFAQSILLKDLPIGPLTLRDAIRLGLEANLGLLDQRYAATQTHGQMRQTRSALLPNLSGSFKEVDQENSLSAQGLRAGLIPGVQFPQVVGPYNYFDLRATLKQTLFDATAINNLRAAKASLNAARYAMEDAQDTVVLAVAGSYLQVVAAQARVDSAKAQVASAKASYDQTAARRTEGLNPQLDVNRSQVSYTTEQQRLITLENDLAKQKLNFERIVGLPADETLGLAEYAPFASVPDLSFDEALRNALETRADIKQAKASLEAAERSLNEARAERLPSVSFSGDYGEIGVNPSQAKSTYNVTGTVHLPHLSGRKDGG